MTIKLLKLVVLVYECEFKYVKFTLTETKPLASDRSNLLVVDEVFEQANRSCSAHRIDCSTDHWDFVPNQGAAVVVVARMGWATVVSSNTAVGLVGIPTLFGTYK